MFSDDVQLFFPKFAIHHGGPKVLAAIQDLFGHLKSLSHDADG
jgi:hypothetical protein